MNTPTELPRRMSWGRKAVGALIAVGVALAASSPAMADKWNNPGHNKHWKHNHGGYYSYYQPRPRVVYRPAPVYYQPAPVYVQPAPVYVQPAPVYVQPAPVYVAPPPVYYQPAPVYHRPQVNIVFPLDF